MGVESIATTVIKAGLGVQLQAGSKMNIKQEHQAEMTERLAPVSLIPNRSILTGLAPIRLVFSRGVAQHKREKLMVKR